MNTIILITPLLIAAAAGPLPVDPASRETVQSLGPEITGMLKALPGCSGKPALTVTVERIPDVTCRTGGKLIMLGDDENADGKLDNGEIDNVIDLCWDRESEQLAALRQQDRCLHLEVAGALRFSIQLDRALAPEHRPTPAELLRPLFRVPNDS